MWMECGCAAQRLGMMDCCCLSVGWQHCLRSVCGQAAPEPEGQNSLVEQGRSGGVMWVLMLGCTETRIHPYFLFPAAYFLFPAVPEQQMGLKMQACAAAAPSGVSVRK